VTGIRFDPQAVAAHAAAGKEGRKGVVLKLFGVVLFALGALDSMLSWRGGIADTDPYFILLVAGAFVYALGAIRGAGGPVRDGRRDHRDRSRDAEGNEAHPDAQAVGQAQRLEQDHPLRRHQPLAVVRRDQ
jgi:hypothetical protein